MSAIPQRTGNDHHEKLLLANINKFGWHCVNGLEDDGHPPWTHTVGLYETWDEPEFLLIGRSRATSHHIFDLLATRIEAGNPPDLTAPVLNLIPGCQCLFVAVAERHFHDYAGFARWYYRNRHFPLYQIVWPNNEGLYPWHEKAGEHFRRWQPILGEASGAG